MFQNQPALSEQAQRVLDLKGQLPLSQLDPRLALGIQVEDWGDFEFKYLRRTLSFQQIAGAPAVAAQFPQVALLQPVGGVRGVLAHIKRLTFLNRNAATQTIAFGVNFTGPGGTAGTVAAFSQDDRPKGSPTDMPVSAYRIAQGSAVAALLTTAGQGLRFVTLPAGSTLVVPVDFVLTNRLNGAGTVASNFFLEGLTVLQFLEVTIEWEERQLLTSEL
jgi:hypothetical protein